MAIQYFGTTISGTASERGSMTDPSANEVGVLFLETDTGKIYHWDNNSWEEIVLSDASTSAKGIASFSSNNFAASSGVITIKNGGVILGTETTGNYVATVAGTDNEVDVSASTGTVTIGLPNDVTIGNDLTVTGDLLVSGDTVTVNTANLAVEDPLIYLSRNVSSSPTFDSGFIVERGNTTNVGFFWDHTGSEFVVANVPANEVGTTAGNVTIDSYANLRAGSLGLSGTFTATMPIATVNAFNIHNGAVSSFAINTNTTTAGVSAINFDTTNPTFASNTNTWYTLAEFNAYTLTLTGTTTLANLQASVRFSPTTITDTSAVDVTKATTIEVTAPIEHDAVTLATSSAIRILNTSGSPTIQAGIHIEELTSGVTKDYAIYTAGATESSFGGNVIFGNTILSSELLNAATGGITIGLAASAPSPDQDGVHMWWADAGVEAATNAGHGSLVLENDGLTWIQFLTTNSSEAGFLFRSPDGADNFFQFSYTGNYFYWRVESANRAYLSEQGFKIGANDTDRAGGGATQPTNALSVFNGTAPVGTLANGFSIYSSSGQMNTMDSAGLRMRLSGGTIDVESGDLTIDSAGDIILDADNSDIFLKDGGTLFGTFTNDSNQLVIKSSSSGTVAATFSGANVTFAGSVGSGAITASGDVTGSTILATTDTSTGDDAAMGYTSAEGLILTGQGSTTDVTIKNDADATVLSIPTGTTNVVFAGNVTTTGLITGGSLDIDNVEINGNTISTSSSTLTLNPATTIEFNGNTVNGSGNFNTNTATGAAVLDEAVSATNPTLVPNRAEVNTGIGWASADNLSLITGGAERMRISGADVGIGTTPSYRLHVKEDYAEVVAKFHGTNTNSGWNMYFLLENDGGASTYFGFLQGSAQGYIKYTVNNEFIIQTDGMTDRANFNATNITFNSSVGIGGAPNTWNRLKIQGDVGLGYGSAYIDVPAAAAVTAHNSEQQHMMQIKGTITEADDVSKVSPLYTNLKLMAPVITSGAGSVISTSVLYIQEIMSAGTGNNYGIWVDIGGVRIDGGGTSRQDNKVGGVLSVGSSTVNGNNVSGTIAVGSTASIGITTFTNDNATLTMTDAASLYIAGVPVAGTRTVITNTPLALWVDAGKSRFDGDVTIGSGSPADGKVWTATDSAGAGNWETPVTSLYEEFTGTGTYTKPAGAVLIYVECIGAGGGGGGGEGRGVGTLRLGGGGGGGAAKVVHVFNAAEVGSTETVTVAGTAAAGAGGTNADGAAATDGGNSSFGSLLIGYGGSKGPATSGSDGQGGRGSGYADGDGIISGATNAQGLAGAAQGWGSLGRNAEWGGGSGAGSANGGHGFSGGSSIEGAGGGASGEGVGVGNDPGSRGTGGTSGTYSQGGGGAAGAEGTGSGGGNGGAGSAVAGRAGQGGGGGGADNGATGGIGGAGAVGGGGGGGGGGTNTGGLGGVGGAGRVRVWTTL